MRRFAIPILAPLVLPALAAAQTASTVSQPANATPASTFALTVSSIMRGSELVGRPPQNVRWTPDGRWIYFQWLEPGTDWRERLKPYRVRADGGAKPERLSRAQMDSVGPLVARGELSPDRTLRAVEYDADLWIVDVKRGSTRRLTRTLDGERDPHFSADGKRLFFLRNDNVYSMELDGGLVTQLSDVREGPAPDTAPPKLTAQRERLQAEQKALFDVIRDRVRADSIAKAETAARDSEHTHPLYLGKGEHVSDLSISPNGRALLLSTSTPASGERTTDVPQYVTLSGYTEELHPRGKVGDDQGSGRLAFISLPSGTSRWLHLSADTTAPPAATQLLGWSDDGRSALVFTTEHGWKRRSIARVDADSGRATMLDVLADSAWVDGPCFGCAGWYDGGKRAWFVSEADGWAHLYTVAADGSDRRQLTSGKWEVDQVDLSRDQKYFEIHTSEPSLFERHFYRVSVNGGARERITTVRGGHDVTVSPDGQWLADVFSTDNRPPELFVMRYKAGAPMKQLTTSPTAEWLSFPWLTPEIVMVPASDGAKVPARIYRPADMHAKANGAAVIFIHGAGYLHEVKHYWSDYYHEYMFNHLLASRGYVVLDLDYRGSAGYGRDWRTAIYRHMGGRDLQDQVDGSRYLQQQFGISPKRIGLYGGSYGGFLTLMALFTESRSFGAGAALRSVTDWSHYNDWYTARILNFPDMDTLAYRQSSPIYFAEGLQDPLLMAHGMVDMNVHFQDIVRLTQRFIELGKTNWELAVYPVEDHGFVRPTSWTDEYRRILELFDAHLPVNGGVTGTGGH